MDDERSKPRVNLNCLKLCEDCLNPQNPQLHTYTQAFVLCYTSKPTQSNSRLIRCPDNNRRSVAPRVLLPSLYVFVLNPNIDLFLNPMRHDDHLLATIIFKIW